MASNAATDVVQSTNMSTGAATVGAGAAIAAANDHVPGRSDTAPQSKRVRKSSDAEPKWLAIAAFGLAFAIPILAVPWRLLVDPTPPFAVTAGGVAAYVCTLLGAGLVLSRPALIMDDSPDAGGEPSTMRLLCLAIIFSFCAVMLRTAWNTNSVPSLQDQGNWVWLVTAALGGKALQKFAEMKK